MVHNLHMRMYVGVVEETPALQCIASNFMECVSRMIPMKATQLSCIKKYRGTCACRNFVVYKMEIHEGVYL